MRRLLALALLLAWPASAQYARNVTTEVVNVDGSSSASVPASCITAGMVPFLGSPVSGGMQCDAGISYDAATDTLTVPVIDLTTQLALADGGTGADLSAIAKGGLITGTGAGTVGVKAVGADGTFLKANAAVAGGVEWAAGGGGVTNSAGANVVTKSNGTNLVASSVTDNGTTLTLGNAGVTVTEATGVVAITAQAAGTTPLVVSAASGQTANVIDVKDSTGTVTMFGFGKEGNWSTKKNSIDKRLYWTFEDSAGALSLKRGSSATARYFNVFDSTLLTALSGDGSSFSISYAARLVPKADNTTGKVAWGEDAASPQAITHVLSAGGSGTNVAGADAIQYPGPGTGSAPSGNWALRTFAGGSSGTTAGTPGDRIKVVAGPKTLTESSATGICDISIPQGTVAGVEVLYTVRADDGTDFQARVARYRFAVVNKAGTLTVSTGSVVGTEEVAVSSGTLTVTPTVTTGTDKVTVNLNAVSSLTQTALRATYRVELDGTGTVSPL